MHARHNGQKIAGNIQRRGLRDGDSGKPGCQRLNDTEKAGAVSSPVPSFAYLLLPLVVEGQEE